MMTELRDPYEASLRCSGTDSDAVDVGYWHARMVAIGVFAICFVVLDISVFGAGCCDDPSFCTRQQLGFDASSFLAGHQHDCSHGLHTGLVGFLA